MKLQQLFSYTFSGKIWNMCIDTHAVWLVLEIRHETQYKTIFSVINLKNNQLHKNEIELNEPWWVGISAIVHDTLLLHTYKNQKNLAKASLMAYDMKAHQLLWTKNNAAFVSCLDAHRIVIQQGHDNTNYAVLAVAHGEMLGILANTSEKISAFKKQQSRQFYPMHLTEAAAGFETIQRFIHTQFRRKAVKGCDYLEYKTLVMVSFYYYQKDLLHNDLVVVNDQAGTIRLHTTLDTALQGIGFDTFFVTNNQLLFLENKNILKGYAL